MEKDLFNKNDLIIFGIIVFLIIILYFKKTENLEIQPNSIQVSEQQDLSQVPSQKAYAGQEVPQKAYAGQEVPQKAYAGQEVSQKAYAGQEVPQKAYAGQEVSQSDLSMNKIKMDDINIVEKTTTENIRTDSNKSQNLNDDFRMKVCNMCTPFNSGFGAGISVDQYSNLENENKNLKNIINNLQNENTNLKNEYNKLIDRHNNLFKKYKRLYTLEKLKSEDQLPKKIS